MLPPSPSRRKTFLFVCTALLLVGTSTILSSSAEATDHRRRLGLLRRRVMVSSPSVTEDRLGRRRLADDSQNKTKTEAPPSTNSSSHEDASTSPPTTTTHPRHGDTASSSSQKKNTSAASSSTTTSSRTTIKIAGPMTSSFTNDQIPCVTKILTMDYTFQVAASDGKSLQSLINYVTATVLKVLQASTLINPVVDCSSGGGSIVRLSASNPPASTTQHSMINDTCTFNRTSTVSTNNATTAKTLTCHRRTNYLDLVYTGPDDASKMTADLQQAQQLITTAFQTMTDSNVDLVNVALLWSNATTTTGAHTVTTNGTSVHATTATPTTNNNHGGGITTSNNSNGGATAQGHGSSGSNPNNQSKPKSVGLNKGSQTLVSCFVLALVLAVVVILAWIVKKRNLANLERRFEEATSRDYSVKEAIPSNDTNLMTNSVHSGSPPVSEASTGDSSFDSAFFHSSPAPIIASKTSPLSSKISVVSDSVADEDTDANSASYSYSRSIETRSVFPSYRSLASLSNTSATSRSLRMDDSTILQERSGNSSSLDVIVCPEGRKTKVRVETLNASSTTTKEAGQSRLANATIDKSSPASSKQSIATPSAAAADESYADSSSYSYSRSIETRSIPPSYRSLASLSNVSAASRSFRMDHSPILQERSSVSNNSFDLIVSPGGRQTKVRVEALNASAITEPSSSFVAAATDTNSDGPYSYSLAHSDSLAEKSFQQRTRTLLDDASIIDDTVDL
jgi:hypothetical protein